MKKTLWTLIAIAALAAAQEKASTPEFISKLIPVRYVNTNHLQGLLSVPGVSIKADEGMHVLAVYGRPDAVSTIEEMVKKLDVAPVTPPRAGFELTGYMLSGSNEAAAGRADDIPADLAAAVKQLHTLFSYKRFRLIESFILRGRDQSGENVVNDNSTSGILPGTASEYSVHFNQATVSRGSPSVVHLKTLSLGVSTPTPNRDKDGRTVYRHAGFRTDVDVPEGQKIVVGKSNVNGGEDSLILVLTAKVIE